MSSQTRICVEKILPHHTKELSNMKTVSNSEQHFQKLKAAFYAKKIWPVGATIKICFLESASKIPRTTKEMYKQIAAEQGISLKLDPLQKYIDDNDIPIEEAIKKIVQERWQPFVQLKLLFVDKSDPGANIRISFDPSGGAWSLIGTDCLAEHSDKSTMNLGWFDVATTMHEFGHALGMVHEHQSAFNNQIKWNVQAVDQWAKDTQGWDRQTTKENIIDRYSRSELNGSDYDPMSIMLYFFPASLTLNNKGTHQNIRLSCLDCIWANKMYPNNKDPLKIYKSIYNTNCKTTSNNYSLTESSNSTNIVTIIILVLIFIGCLIGLGIWLSKQKNRVLRYGLPIHLI
jgi:hypothetical protein